MYRWYRVPNNQAVKHNISGDMYVKLPVGLYYSVSYLERSLLSNSGIYKTEPGMTILMMDGYKHNKQYTALIR